MRCVLVGLWGVCEVCVGWVVGCVCEVCTLVGLCVLCEVCWLGSVLCMRCVLVECVVCEVCVGWVVCCV